MAFDESFLAELRDRNDIESVISSYVNLKRKGKLLSGLCPFHNEKTPSFFVYPETQSYYCFGCGSGGDAIYFIKSIENIDYIEAVKLLADRSGMALPEDNFDNGLSKRRARIYEANREAARFFYKQLFAPENKVARDYCKYRQLTKETVTKFGIGYAPDNWTSLCSYLNQKGFSNLELFEADLVKKSEKGTYYDTFRNRLVFPVIDLRGNVVAFSGRRLSDDDKSAKYVNTKDTLVYKKGREIFALNYAKNSSADKLILCEGNIDAVMLHQAGIDNAVAAFGTALTQDQAQLLSKYTGEILLCYDSDEAGQKAVKKAIDIFSNTTLRVKVINMKGGKDPDEIIKKYGVSRFKSYIEGAANDIEYKIMLEREKYDTSTADGKVNFMKAVSVLLAGVSNDIEVDVYAAKLSDELSVSKAALLTEIGKNRRKANKIKEKETFKSIEKNINNPNDLINKVNPERRDNIHAAKAEEIIIATLINNSVYYKDIKDKLEPEVFITSFNKRIYSIISQRLEEGRAIDLTYIIPYLAGDEISVVSKICASAQLVSNSVSELEDCIRVLKEEKGRGSFNTASELSGQDFLNLFNKK